MDVLPPNNTPWYHQKAGIIFLVVLGAVALITLVFLGMVGYYTWQIKFGDTAKLEQTFNPNFTVNPKTAGLKHENSIDTDLDKFIHDHTPVLGGDDAPITILAFIDFECPYCQESYPIFKSITEKYAPVLRIAFKHLPVESLHPQAGLAHLAAACAEEQDKFWGYHDLLFQKKKLDAISLIDYAGRLNLNLPQFENCLNSQKYQEAIDQDVIDAVDLEVRGTPTYILNGGRIEGVMSLEQWDKIILDALQATQK